jgi:hypothetical protein
MVRRQGVKGSRTEVRVSRYNLQYDESQAIQARRQLNLWSESRNSQISRSKS